MVFWWIIDLPFRQDTVNIKRNGYFRLVLDDLARYNICCSIFRNSYICKSHFCYHIIIVYIFYLQLIII